MSDDRGAAADAAAPTFADLCADEAAFTAWYETALPRVYSFVYARTGGEMHVAEDIVAQAFLEGVRARKSFDGRSDPVTWLCAIARNRLVDHYRAEARERIRRLRIVVDDANEPASRDDIAQVEQRDAVLDLLASLPALERLALSLRYLDGYSVAEVADRIGRSIAATESLLMRARDRVRLAFPRGL